MEVGAHHCDVHIRRSALRFTRALLNTPRNFKQRSIEISRSHQRDAKWQAFARKPGRHCERTQICEIHKVCKAAKMRVTRDGLCSDFFMAIDAGSGWQQQYINALPHAIGGTKQFCQLILRGERINRRIALRAKNDLLYGGVGVRRIPFKKGTHGRVAFGYPRPTIEQGRNFRERRVGDFTHLRTRLTILFRHLQIKRPLGITQHLPLPCLAQDAHTQGSKHVINAATRQGVLKRASFIRRPQHHARWTRKRVGGIEFVDHLKHL